MAAVLPHEVFLSHSSQDRQFATDLAGVIRRHGIPVWYSQTNILGAQQWQDEIGAALQRCDWFVLVLSPNSAESMWVKRELSYALQQNRFETGSFHSCINLPGLNNCPGRFPFFK
jgi:hypothetical protein